MLGHVLFDEIRIRERDRVVHLITFSSVCVPCAGRLATVICLCLLALARLRHVPFACVREFLYEGILHELRKRIRRHHHPGVNPPRSARAILLLMRPPTAREPTGHRGRDKSTIAAGGWAIGPQASCQPL